MEIVSLNPAFESIFWKHVNQDIPHYFFFGFDWKNNKDETDILLALTGRRIDGMMLVYKKRIVQFRGNREATRVLWNIQIWKKSNCKPQRSISSTF